MSKFKAFEPIIVKQPANIDGTFSGVVLEVLDNERYTVCFYYQGIQTTTNVEGSQLTSFAGAKFKVVE
ncbi:MAG: hypothetical protein OXM61_10975 [Candidatus Poribacteria bacterium]|nr:hypothetical protein [Candidatus Poribacteria bacterium]